MRRPNLARWLENARPDHPLLDLAKAMGDEPDPVLDAEEELIGSLVSAVDDATVKRREFERINSNGRLVNFHGELLVAGALASHPLAFRLGDTRAANPDFVIDELHLGIEVTSLVPDSVDQLLAATESRVQAAGEDLGATLTASNHVTRVREAERAEILQALDELLSGGEDSRTVTFKDSYNGPKAISITIELDHIRSQNRVSWSVIDSELTEVMSAVEKRALDIARISRKARQAASMDTLLLVDLSRAGLAYIRPSSRWPRILAASIPADYPFVGLGVFAADLVRTKTEVAVAPRPGLSKTLCALAEPLGWHLP